MIVNSDPRLMPFGRYLKAIRVQQGISLEEVAYETRIGLRDLMMIEEEDHDQLPESDQVKSLLRTYAKWIGVDEDDIVDRYEINQSFFYQTENSDRMPPKSGKRFFLIAVVALVLIAAAGAAAYFLYDDYIHRPGAATPLQTEPASEDKKGFDDTAKSAVPAAIEVPESVVAGKVAVAPAPAEKLLLEIDATQETMIKIGVDDADLVAYLLNAGDHIELEALTRIRMEVGNPEGVKVLLNNEPVVIKGKNGEIVTLDLTHPQ